jgi:pentatricopeptide repeat protein
MLTDSSSGKPIDSRLDMSFEPCPDQSKKLEQGREAHACIVRESLDTDPIIVTSLVNMYGKLEQFGDAESLFSMANDRDAVMWSSVIALAAHRGLAKEADGLYERMKQEGSMPDAVTLVSVVDAYASEMNIRDGKRIHACVVPMPLASETALATCIVTMYGKCSDVGNARDVFDSMLEPSVVSWNAMLGVYGEHQEECKEAFQMFHSLRNASVLPDSATFACILDACAGNASLPEGKRVHMLVRNSGFERDVVVMTALVNMYGKCGNLEAACANFEEMEVRNAVTWTALIAAFARNGRYHKAVQLFGEMEQEGIRPDGVTFVTILSACRHAGCVDEALEWLDLMKRYALAPGEKHYECVIDLLARAGRLDEAEELAKELSYMPSILSCTALLQSCILHRTDVDRGERIAEGAFKLDLTEPAPYLILSKIYAAAESRSLCDNMKRTDDDDVH